MYPKDVTFYQVKTINDCTLATYIVPAKNPDELRKTIGKCNDKIEITPLGENKVTVEWDHKLDTAYFTATIQNQTYNYRNTDRYSDGYSYLSELFTIELEQIKELDFGL